MKKEFISYSDYNNYQWYVWHNLKNAGYREKEMNEIQESIINERIDNVERHLHETINKLSDNKYIDEEQKADLEYDLEFDCRLIEKLVKEKFVI